MHCTLHTVIHYLKCFILNSQILSLNKKYVHLKNKNVMDGQEPVQEFPLELWFVLHECNRC